jgi:hypothetical protein
VLTPTVTSAEAALELFRTRPAIYRQADAMERPWPGLDLGTGGLAGEAFLTQSYGYKPFQVLAATPPANDAPFAKLMQQVKSGFGRTMSRLPEVFGVSRQTLYNWLDGETPKVSHQERIRQLAQAASVFSELGIKPTPLMLDRVITQGKSFLQLMADGADGNEVAKKLIRVTQRGNEARAKLNVILTGRKPKPEAADFGSAALDESA